MVPNRFSPQAGTLRERLQALRDEQAQWIGRSYVAAAGSEQQIKAQQVLIALEERIQEVLSSLLAGRPA